MRVSLAIRKLAPHKSVKFYKDQIPEIEKELKRQQAIDSDINAQEVIRYMVDFFIKYKDHPVVLEENAKALQQKQVSEERA